MHEIRRVLLAAVFCAVFISSPVVAYEFSYAAGTLEIIGNASGSAPGNCCAQWQPDIFCVSSCVIVNRNNGNSCSASGGGTLHFLAFIDETTGNPSPPGLNSIPARVHCLENVTIYVPVMVQAIVGACWEGTATASASVGNDAGVATSPDGGSQTAVGDFEAHVSIQTPLWGMTDFQVPFSMSASHANARCKAGVACISRVYATLTTDAYDNPNNPAVGRDRASRQGDWDAGYTMTSQYMNPGPDNQYYPTWSYDYVDDSPSISTEQALSGDGWYMKNRTKLVWHDSYQPWIRYGSSGPFITHDALHHLIDAGNIRYVPCYSWINRYHENIMVKLTDSLRVDWIGTGSSPVSAEVIVAKRRHSDNQYETLFDKVVSGVGGDIKYENLNNLECVCNYKDEILVSVKGLAVVSGGDVALNDCWAKWTFIPITADAGDIRGMSKPLLLENYPNPFNPSTTIGYYTSGKCWVSLKVYDISGKLVTLLENGEQEAGVHTAEWKGVDEKGNPVASGVYFYRLTAGKETVAKKMVLLR